MLRRQLTLCILVVLVAAICGTIAGPASAGTYVVTSCRASSTHSFEGWSHQATPGTVNGLPYFWDGGTCTESGAGLYRRFELNGVPAGATDDWTFTAPSGTWITYADIDQVAIARSYNSLAGIWAKLDDGTTSALDMAFGDGNTGQSFGDATYGLPVSGPKAVGLRSIIACQGGGVDCSGQAGLNYGAEYTLSAATIWLTDPSTPTFSSISGTGWNAAPVDGIDSVDYAVSDSGSGIAGVSFYVDGLLQATHASSCTPGMPVPCPLARQGSFTFDTTRLSEGPHTVSVLGRDAAGNANASDAYQRTITVRRPPHIESTAPVSTSNPGWQGTGPPAVGDRLEGSGGTWTGNGNTFAYQWMRCDSVGQNCTAISAANGIAYTPTIDDVGHTLIFCVTATNSGGTTTSCSAPTAVVVREHPGETSESSSTGPTGAAASGTSLGPALTSSDRGEPNGSPAADRATLTALINSRSRTQKVKFGKRVPISGRLLGPNAVPIRGAILSVLTQTATPGAAMAEVSQIVTDRDGRFRYVAPAGSSRTIRIAYRSYSADASFADTTDVRLLVAAGVTLKPTRKRLRNHEATTFTGRVLGRPVPRRGVVVDLQVLFRKKWRTFAAPRTNAAGSYRFKYRFMAGAATWKFRARVRTDSSYPYALGYSRRSVKITVVG